MSLNVIAAVVIGGVSIYGAIGNVPGVIAGSVLLSVITIGLVLVRVPGSMQDFFVGLVLIVAVIVDNLRRSRMFKASVEKAADIEPAV
jgi:ribose/xylose/arabinose/galactoside ABC-type transport system permease subunit